MTAHPLKLISLLLCFTIITAFTSSNPRHVARRVSSVSTQTFMASPLEEVSEGEDASAVFIKSDDKNVAQNLGRGGEFKEVKWKDPAMSANTNPFEMSFWAYFLFGYPFLLLADDAFHFIPDSVKEGPLGAIF